MLIKWGRKNPLASIVGWARSRILLFVIFTMNGRLPNHIPLGRELVVSGMIR